MAAATTTDQFLDLLRKSGLVESSRLDAFLATVGETVRQQPRSLADVLVRQGFLTPFQAGQLLSGKWRGFFIASGKYKLLQLLGVGGMGRVYLCEHLRMRRLVALKVLPEEQTKDESSVERFNREAQAAAALNHPNIVRAYDIDLDGSMHFLVMEYVDGASLQDIVKKHGPFDVNRAAHYISQAAVGLQHAHEAGWVHRDIKPGNLLLDRNGVVKILDMGLARLFHTPDADKLTQKFDNQAVLGTADYLAPEQAVNSSDVDIRADIYSLGATLYFLLTGRAPFEDGSVAQKLLAHQSREPDSVSTIRPEVPKQLDAVIKKMMAKKPVNRFQTPQEVVEALQTWTEVPVELPADEEMGRLCPALVSYVTPTSGSAPLSGISGITGPASGRMRKPASGARTSSYLLRKGFTFELSRWAKARPGLLIGICIGVVLSFCIVVFTLTRRPSIGPIIPPGVSAPDSDASVHTTRQKPSWAPTVVKPEIPATRTIYVSQHPQGADRSPAYRTVNEAITHVASGMRIIILDENVEGNIVLDDRAQHAGLILEAGPNQNVVWQPSVDSGTLPVIEIRGVPNVRLKGFTIRGAARTSALVRVQGSCPGLRLEDVKLTDFPLTAMEFSGVDSAADDAMVVQKTRFVTVRDYASPTRDKAGDVRDNAITIAVSRPASPGGPALIVRDCRFEGMYKSTVEITGPIAAEFYRNRFFTLRDDERPTSVQNSEAFFWKPGPTAEAPRLTIASNTAARYPAFIRMAQLPAGATAAGPPVDLRSNLMVGGTMWATGPGKPDDPVVKTVFAGGGNVARPKTCTLGYDIPRKYVEFKNPSFAMDDEHFLRYPKQAPGENKPNDLLTAGANNEPAGYPPYE
ncbi:MAG: protein kinase domain-containing protein [Gemmataceae bacterium]